MILDSRKGAKIRKEVEIPLHRFRNSKMKDSCDSSDLCSKKKLISTRLYFFEHESHRSHEFYNRCSVDKYSNRESGDHAVWNSVDRYGRTVRASLIMR